MDASAFDAWDRYLFGAIRSIALQVRARTLSAAAAD